jgi:hypothetical protein
MAQPESKNLTIWSRITTSSALENADKILIGLGSRGSDIFAIEIIFETFEAAAQIAEKIELLKYE